MHTRARRSAKVDVRAENLDNKDSKDSIDDLRTERGWGEEDPDEVRTDGFEYDRYGGGRRATPDRASGRFGDSVSARLHPRSQGFKHADSLPHDGADGYKYRPEGHKKGVSNTGGRKVVHQKAPSKAINTEHAVLQHFNHLAMKHKQNRSPPHETSAELKMNHVNHMYEEPLVSTGTQSSNSEVLEVAHLVSPPLESELDKQRQESLEVSQQKKVSDPEEVSRHKVVSEPEEVSQQELVSEPEEFSQQEPVSEPDEITQHEQVSEMTPENSEPDGREDELPSLELNRWSELRAQLQELESDVPDGHVAGIEMNHAKTWTSSESEEDSAISSEEGSTVPTAEEDTSTETPSIETSTEEKSSTSVPSKETSTEETSVALSWRRAPQVLRRMRSGIPI